LSALLTNPTKRLSGDQKVVKKGLSAPGSGCAARESSERSQSTTLPSALGAL
jgi:hypothetical protein